MKPFPAIESLQEAQTKHCECQCLPSKEIKRVPPAPENRRLLFIICKLFIYILQQKINKFFFGFSFLTCDWFTARRASFCKQFPKTIGTIRFIISRSKLLSSKNTSTIGAKKTFSMPCLEKKEEKIMGFGKNLSFNNCCLFDHFYKLGGPSSYFPLVHSK